MRWPWQKKPDPILRDVAALDLILQDERTRRNVLTYLVQAEAAFGAATPEALADIATEWGLDHDAALLLLALAARLEGAK